MALPTLHDVLFDIEDGVTTITINRPSNANSFTINTVEELCALSIECDDNPEVRAVLLTGTGRMFSSGADLNAFIAEQDAATFVKKATTFFHMAISRFARMNPPVIAAVNGIAAGGGFSFAISCDLVLAAESAMFTSAYTNSAISPDGSSTYFLPRLVGLRRAQELFLTNRRLSAAEALEWGLVTRVVPDDRLMDEARALAKQLASGPTLAYGGVKRLLASSFESGLETQMEYEARSIADMSASHDLNEGVAAFVERRDPSYQGR